MSTPEPPPFPGDSNPEPSGGLPSYGSVPPPPDPPGGLGGSVPPPPPPPAPPVGSSGFSPAEAIAWGWRKFTQNTGSVLLAVLACLGVFVAVGIITAALGGGFQFSVDATNPTAMPSTGPGDILSQIIGWVVGSLLTAAFARAALDVADGQAFDFFGAFKRIPIGTVLLASLLVGIATIIGFILLIIPGLIVAFLTFLTTYAVVDTPGISPIDAIKTSFRLVKDNVGPSLLLILLSFLVVIAGLCALCIGLVVAYPVTIFATAYAYRSFNGQPVAP